MSNPSNMQGNNNYYTQLSDNLLQKIAMENQLLSKMDASKKHPQNDEIELSDFEDPQTKTHLPHEDTQKKSYSEEPQSKSRPQDPQSKSHPSQNDPRTNLPPSHEEEDREPSKNPRISPKSMEGTNSRGNLEENKQMENYARMMQMKMKQWDNDRLAQDNIMRYHLSGTDYVMNEDKLRGMQKMAESRQMPPQPVEKHNQKIQKHPDTMRTHKKNVVNPPSTKTPEIKKEKSYITIITLILMFLLIISTHPSLSKKFFKFLPPPTTYKGLFFRWLIIAVLYIILKFIVEKLK
jgi:hypothetical protein